MKQRILKNDSIICIAPAPPPKKKIEFFEEILRYITYVVYIILATTLVCC